MVPLLYFGRHVIQNSIQFSLYQISNAGETIASPKLLVLVVTTCLGVGLVHLLSSSVFRTQQTSRKNDDSDKSQSVFRRWFFSLPIKEYASEEKTQSDGGLQNNKDADDGDEIPVEVRMQQEDKLDEYPFLLSEEQCLMIQKNVLPASLMGYKWKRLYSVARDGDSFSTCEKSLAGQRRTLFVIQTSSSNVIGAYCDTKWKLSGPTAFEGGVGTCLYRLNDDDPSSVDVYRWTGENRMIAVCDQHKKRIGFGGGQGSFGLCIDSNFTKGHSSSCPTFGNPPLCGEGEQSFPVIDMEVYGFLVV